MRVAKVTRQDVPLEIRAVGNVEAYSTVAVKSRIAGQVDEVAFAEGDHVHAGDLLFSIDSRTLAAGLKQAKANLARDVAASRLAQAEAGRQKQLLASGVSSQEAVDVATTRAETAEAAIEVDNAAIESARLYLGYCSIRSPLDGIVGEILVHAGNVVKENDTTLAVIRQQVPILVRFAVPERHLAAIRDQARQGALQVTATPPGDDSSPAVGELRFLDNTVDPTTGTILLKGLFPNRDERLWPGQFVDVSLTLALRKDVVVVPDRAISLGQDGSFAFVVRDDRTVESRAVVAERADGGLSVVEQGLSPGETVVVDGQLRLVSGSRVTVVEDRTGDGPSPAPAPAQRAGGAASPAGGASAAANR